MAYSAQTPTADYRQSALEASVNEASPKRLIQLLMQKLLMNLNQAYAEMAAGSVQRKGELIGKSISIVDCLRTSLDFSHGADVTENLERLYDFMQRELLLANLHNRVDGLGAVIAVVEELKSAWDQVDAEPPGQRV